MRFCLLLLLLFFSLFSGAQTYQGTIGSYPVYLFMDGQNNVDGYYCYQSQLITIYFEGEISETSISLDVFDENGNTTETFLLAKNGSQLSGSWKKNDKQLPVELKMVTAIDTKLPRFEKNPEYKADQFSDYEQLLLSQFRLKSLDSSNVEDNVKISYFEEIHSHAVWFRVDSGMPKQQMDWINHCLEVQHMREFTSNLQCYQVRNRYFNNYNHDFLYRQGFFCWFNDHVEVCNSFREDIYATAYNFDLINFKVLESEKLLTNEAMNVSGMKDSEGEDLSNIQALLITYFTRIAPDMMLVQTNEDDAYYDDCNYISANYWDFSEGILFTEDGLRILINTGWNRPDCMNPEWAVIPYEELENYFDETLLKRLYKIKPKRK